jgi:hypothetical protein
MATKVFDQTRASPGAPMGGPPAVR